MKEEIMQALIAGEEVDCSDVLGYINELKEQVRKETAKEIRERISNVECLATENAFCFAIKLDAEFDKIFTEYGVEVDE